MREAGQNRPLVTVGITSYKRINELERCIRSIRTQYPDDIEILVSEDKSPLEKEIGEKVSALAAESEYEIRFTSNEKNLGYDMNLGAIIRKARGEWIFYMSDDDGMTDGFLDLLIPFLKKGTEAGVVYAPFVYPGSGERDRVRGKEDFAIPAGEESAAKYIYDSILFSGLVFRKEYVKDFDASRFKNHNYFQVYMFLQMLLKHGGYWFAAPSVNCFDDGENAYGIAESSGGDAALANRKSVISNLAFNKTLIKVIRMFDEDEGTHVMDSFAKQYSLHSYSGLSKARKEGVKYFKEYWKTLNGLDIKLYPITKAYYVILRVMGKDKADKLLSGAKKRLKGNG